ncbi:MAG: hypothetical protein ACI9XO_000275 [Paraglaciecola sp.]|jgi:hypothetical protein
MTKENNFIPNSELIHSDSVTEGVINADKNYNAVMIGATEKSIYPQILFGNIPEIIAKILVK